MTNKKIDETKLMEVNIRSVIKHIGENPDREGLKDTPKRVVKMWKELFRGYSEKPPKVTTFTNGNDDVNYDQMINDNGDYYSHCEHHMVPFFGKFYFAYIPDSPENKGRVVGLSKVARVVDYFSARLQIQERLGQNIVDYLWEALSCGDEYEEKDGEIKKCINTKTQPIAMGLVLEGKHLCKSMRGAKKEGCMRTAILKGTFKTDPSARSEFLSWVNNR